MRTAPSERAIGASLFYAIRFTAKEACAKALGTGITERVRWTDIEVLADPTDQPILALSGGALRRLRWLSGDRELKSHLSVDFGGSYVLALVVLEAS